MDATTNLNLPFIMAAQAQKHVTHNEALRALDAVVQLMVLDKDLATPPGSPAEGARYIVAASPTGAWSGQAGKIAAFQDGAWAFYGPLEGWIAWVADEDILYAWSGTAWGLLSGGGGGGLADVVDDSNPQLGGDLDTNAHNIDFDDTKGIRDDAGNEQLVFAKVASAVNHLQARNAAASNAPQLSAVGDDTNIDLKLAGKGSGHPKADLFGVNATADTTTRFIVAAAASLFNHAGNGHQHKINKNAAGDTASLLFQTATSGRAEMGTAGDDDFHVKVSPDGSAWTEGIVVDKSTGAARFPATGYLDLPAASAPGTPASGKVRIYAKTDKSFYQKDDAGLETGLAGGGSGGGVVPNLLVNSDGRIDQRNGGSAATTSDDAYGGPDRWYSLTQTAAIQVQRQVNGEDGMPFFQRLTQTQATAQRMGRAQIIEGRDCRHLRGQSAVLSGRIRCSSAQAIRYAILEWTGTEDAVTSDVVNAWTNGTFTAGQFFNSTTLNVLGTGAITPSASTWADLTELAVTCGSSLANVIVFIWTEATAAQNVTLDFRLKLEKAGAATPFVHRPTNHELELCYRFYQKSYNLDTAPGTATDVGAISTNNPATIAGIAALNTTLPARLRATPTTTWHSTNSGAAGNVYNSTDAADRTVSSTSQAGEARSGFPSLSAAQDGGDQLRAHFTCEAEL